MASYSGILSRGDTFNTIYNSPPIAREMVTAGEHIGWGTMASNVYWLNPAVLSKIGEVTDDAGTFAASFKTSDIAIDYDGTGYLKEMGDHLLVDGLYQFRYDALDALEALTDTNFTFGTMDIDVAVLDHISTKTTTITDLTTTSITATWTKGNTARVTNETTGTYLGAISTSGGSLSFSAQTSGQVISVVILDSAYNYSAKTIGSVP